MVTLCSFTKIFTPDGSSSICNECIKKLRITYIFINQCQISDLILRKILNILLQRESILLQRSELNKYSSKNMNFYRPTNQNMKDIDFYQVDLSNVFEQQKLFIEKYVVPMNEEIKTPQSIKMKADDLMALITDRKSYINSEVFDPTKDLKLKSSICTFCNKNIDEHNKNNTDFCSEANHFKDNYIDDHNSLLSCRRYKKKYKTKYEILMNENDTRKKNLKTRDSFLCDLCNKPFATANNLAIHFYNHAKFASKKEENLDFEETTLKCNLCLKSLKLNELIDHVKNEHSTFCELCTKDYNNQEDFLNHLYIHGVQLQQCQICFKKFENLDKLKFHQEVHITETSKNIFICPICKDKFTSKQFLLEHSVQHLSENYKCEKCKRCFNNIVSYECHVKQHIEPKYLCFLCGKQYCSNISLACHIRAHNNEKPYMCTFCQKSFNSRSTLSVHKRIHSTHKPYVCSYCGYSCRQSGDLAMHIRTHTGVKPYTCTFPNCERKFTTSSQRQEHYRRHINDRKHKCIECGKAFLESKTLKVHMLVHSDEKPHGCEVCGKKFRRAHHLANHVKSHTVVSTEIEFISL